jgi:hypothetical protein
MYNVRLTIVILQFVYWGGELGWITKIGKMFKLKGPGWLNELR